MVGETRGKGWGGGLNYLCDEGVIDQFTNAFSAVVDFVLVAESGGTVSDEKSAPLPTSKKKKGRGKGKGSLTENTE